MNSTSFMSYLSNCMLLILPIIGWNVIFQNKLPQAYSKEIFDLGIPAFISNGENMFRLFVLMLPMLMPFRIDTLSQKLGLWLYILGTAIYFLSWMVQMYFPQSAWSLSVFGFLAPAYTPLIWLTGIGLIGSTLYFSSVYRSWMYIALAIIFIGFHLSHAIIVYFRNFQ